MPVITPERRIVVADAGDPARGPVHDERISEAGGLTQFGAFIQTLPPGSRSSILHWHAEEDEMVYVLEGEVIIVEGATETLLRPGDAATFRAGDPVGHSLENRSGAPTRCGSGWSCSWPTRATGRAGRPCSGWATSSAGPGCAAS